MSISSQEFLRDQLARYMKGKDIQIAEMEAQLISSILQGYVARWPGRELGQPLSETDTIAFLADIKAESGRQMRSAGFTRKDAQLNLEYLSNVIRHFFVGAGIFTDLDTTKG